MSNGRAGRFLPYGRQQIDEDDIAAVAEVLRGDYLTTGPAVAAFEQALRGVTGANHAVACANGTAGLHLAALALDLKPGHVAVVPSLTFLATANAVRLTGAEVVFADVDPATGLMGADHLEAALSRTEKSRVRAVFPVHLNGQCVDMESVGACARRHGLAVVEDACHALGANQRMGNDWIGTGACAASDMAVFSFHPVKTVAMGEGGAVTCADETLDRRLRSLRSHGLTREASEFTVTEQAFDAEGQPNPWYYEMHEVGLNYRASDINCALGLSQINKLPRFQASRARIMAEYARLLAPLAPIVRLVPQMSWSQPSWHIAVAHIDTAAAGTTRAKLVRQLFADGIGTQVHYLPVHRQPYYRERYGLADLPGADAYYAGCLTLPMFVGMELADVARVAQSLRSALG
ncbi:MAG: UDP-4-amino-4,6-dideoxy-N-acetyl-beta-L-altrosamine transaminase [Rhodospirillaceae bacterium]|nr:UDP-4-amino-4,6-dideoxy-N-acetyl-beta-L-altrosamine transaminase [Rhodospirillales bacterium]